MSSVFAVKKRAINLSVSAIKFYRKIAPVRMRNACRFSPTCSEYAMLSLGKYGFFKGWYKAMKRLLRCKAPNGGWDPV